MSLTPEEKQQMDQLAESISKLCHMVISRKLCQIFEIVKEELDKSGAPKRKPMLSDMADELIRELKRQKMTGMHSTFDDMLLTITTEGRSQRTDEG